MNILVSGINTSSLLVNLATGLTALGHCVSSLTRRRERNPFYHNTTTFHFSENEFVERIDGNGDVVPSKKFFNIIGDFDLFIFNTGETLLPGRQDLRILRQAGKKVVFRNTGSNSRFLCPGSLIWNHAGVPFNIIGRDLEFLASCHRRFDDRWEYLKSNTYVYALGPKLYNECMAALHADVLTNGPMHASLCARPYFAAVNTFSPDGITPYVPDNARPIIVHAPSKDAMKGTSAICRQVEDLRAEGLDFEFVLIRRMPNEKLKKILVGVDILIDDLAAGGHGILANEAMAAGCVVLGTNMPDMHPLPRHRPVVPISRRNLKEQIRRIVLDRPFRRRVAEAGIAYVNAVHRPERAAAYLLDNLERAESKDYDYYPTLFLDNPHWPDYRTWIDKTDAKIYSPDCPVMVSDQREVVPDFVRELLARTIMRHGAHPRTDIAAFCRCGLAGDRPLQEHLVPRWDETKLTQVNPWLWLGENAGRGLQDTEELIPFAELNME